MRTRSEEAGPQIRGCDRAGRSTGHPTFLRRDERDTVLPGGSSQASLTERKAYREKITQALYEATEGNRLLGVTGAKLAQDLAIPAEDLAAACTYLVGEDLITVDWTAGNTPAMVTLTHQGIRRMEAEEEEHS